MSAQVLEPHISHWRGSPRIASTGAIVPPPAASQPERVALDSSRVANALLMLEQDPSAEPLIGLIRPPGLGPRIVVSTGPQHGSLTPDEARLMAKCLLADPGEPGSFGIARRLIVMAETADGQASDLPPAQDVAAEPEQPPARSGLRSLISLALLLGGVLFSCLTVHS